MGLTCGLITTWNPSLETWFLLLLASEHASLGLAFVMVELQWRKAAMIGSDLLSHQDQNMVSIGSERKK